MSTDLEEINASFQLTEMLCAKICSQKYSLCAAIKYAISILEERLDNGEHDQWIHTLVKDLEQALNEAVL